jgi:hypothetical protein
MSSLVSIVTQSTNSIRLSNNKLIFEAHGLYKIDYPADQYLDHQDDEGQKLVTRLKRILQDKAYDVILELSFYNRKYQEEYGEIVESNGGW